MTDYEVDEHVDDVSNYNLSHDNDDSESDGEVPVHHQANDSDSDEELSFHHQPNHVHDGYLDSESEIEDTAYEFIRRR